MLTTPDEWKALLKQWESAARGENNGLPASLFRPAVTEAELSGAEARFGAALPPSYKAFLLASNGWDPATCTVPAIRPLSRVDWFKKENRDWIAVYTDPTVAGPLPPDEIYFSYSSDVASDYRPTHFRHTIQISDVGDAAVFLLNPMVIHADGEWEAWFLANWNPGVERYRSFAELMHFQYQLLIGDPVEQMAREPVPFDELPTVYRDGPLRSPRRVEPRKPARPTAELLRVARDHSARTTMSARVKAIRELAARREAAVIPALRALLRDPLPDVRAFTMISLGKLRAADAVGDLIAVVREDDSEEHCALAALGDIGTAAALDFLVECVEAGGINAYPAAMALARHGDVRGVAALTRTMLNVSDRFNGDTAGRTLAQFGAAAIDSLVAGAGHSDAVIRGRAYAGLHDMATMRAKTPEGRRAAEAIREASAVESAPEPARMLQIYLKMVPTAE